MPERPDFYLFDPFDDEDDEAFFAAWEEAEREAAEVLATALRHTAPARPAAAEVAAAAQRLRDAHANGYRPAAWMLRAAGIGTPENVDDEDLLVAAVAATISMVEDPQLPPEEASTIMTLDLADWAGAILGLVRAGPGAAADPSSLVDYAEAAPEIDAPPMDFDDRSLTEDGFMLVLPAWEAAGVVEDAFGNPRLTRIGAWVLPLAAARAWGGASTSGGAEVDAGRTAGSWQERLAYEELEELGEDEERQAEGVYRHLRASGALMEDELIARLVKDGTIAADDADEASALVWDLPGTFPLRDGRLVDLPSLAEGRTFTHRLTAREVEEQRLAVLPDLALYLTFVPPPLALEGGGELRLHDWRGPDEPERGSSLFGPTGWLPEDAEPGRLVACRVEDGEVTVALLDDGDLDVEAAELAAAHLREAFDALGGRNVVGGPLDAPELLAETIARFPTVFRRPVAPVADLLGQAGLTHDDAVVVDPNAPQIPEVDEWLAQVPAFDHHDIEAVRILLGSIELFEREQLEEIPADTAQALVMMLAAYPGIPEAVIVLSLGIMGEGTPGLGRLVRLLAPHARGRDAAPLYLIEARVAEMRGDALAGEAVLRKAVQADPDYTPAHEELAWYLEDRGDAAGALAHLRRAGIGDDDPQVTRLKQWQARRTAAGRNEPCPCGSGAKFKKCCERTGGPLPDRADWVLGKATAYLARPRQHLDVIPLIEARAGDATYEERTGRAMGDGLVIDVALFEEGLLGDFLDERGVLLPADERALAASWHGIGRSLYELVEVSPGEGMELLDLRSGERLRVRARRASRQLGPGATIYARVLPDGDGHQLSPGTIHVPAQHREATLRFLDLDPPAIEICAWVAALEAPPTLVTMEGEPTVLCTAEYLVADTAQAAAALADRYDADDTGTNFVEWVDINGQRWARGRVELAEGRLRIETNAEARLDRFKAVIEEVVEGADLVDESRQHEQAWVDEPIPMLGGLTPRQALADPTRRRTLLAFLDEMEGRELPGAMSARRIRQLLDLDPG